MRLDRRFAGDSMRVTVRVADFPSVNSGTTSLKLTPIADIRLPPAVRVTWFEPPVTLALGDVWELELKLKRPRGAANPGGFDVERWMFRERLYASGYVVPGKRNRLLRSGVLSPIDRIRARVVRALQAVPDSHAVLSAVSVGTRHAILQPQWERYAASGTSHLMAISGLHVGLAALISGVVIYILSVLIGNRGNHVRAATLGGGLFAITYTLVSGMAIPAQRASLMLLMAAIALIAARPVRLSYVLALVAITVYLSDPLSIMAPGFILSFGAVAVLRFSGLCFQPSRNRIARVQQLWMAQLGLLFGLTPLTTTLFSRVSLIAPMVNSIVVPLFSILAVPAILAGTLAVAFDLGFADSLFRIASIGVKAVEQVIDIAVMFTVADITIEHQSGVQNLIAWLAVLWLLLPRGWPGRLLAPLALFCLAVHTASSPRQGCADVAVLDVGQGQAVIVRTARRVLLYDTGPAYRSGGTAADNVILPYLDYMGIRRIDWLVVSHADLDHAGGVRTLRNALEIEQVLVGEPIGVSGLEYSGVS